MNPTTQNPAHEDQSPFVPQQANSLLNQFTGLLSKAADTALDIYELKQTGSQNVVGSYYPTGQVNPAAVASQQQAQAQQQAAIKPDNTKLFIYGGIGIAALAVVVLLARK